jgi:hypothetical protein
MINFVICVKHPDNCYSYKTTWQLLKNTLYSVCNQTDKNFKVLIVANKILDNFEDDKNIFNVEFIEVDFPPPPTAGKNHVRTGMKAIRFDRGSKYVRALYHLSLNKSKEKEHVMFVDADDFISCNLAKYINENQNYDLMAIYKSYCLINSKKISLIDDFNLHAFSYTGIMNLEYLLDELHFEGLNKDNITQSDIFNCSKEYYLKFIIGSHEQTLKYFSVKNNAKILDVNFPAAIYNCSHNEQHSSTSWFDDVSKHRNFIISNLTDEIKKEFNIKLL